MKNMQKKHIFFLIPDMGFGGAQRQITQLLEEYSKNKDIEISLCTIINNFKLWEEKSQRFNSDIRVLCLNKKLGKWNNITAFFSLLNFLKNYQPDIIHAFLGRGIRYAMLAKLIFPHIKLIIAFRNDLYLKSKFFGLEKLNFHRVLKFTVDINTCNSLNALKNSKIYFGYSEKQSRFFPNGVNLELFSRRIMSHSKDEISKFRILLPGRLIEQKNQILVVEAITSLFERRKNLPNFEIIFIGEISSSDYMSKIKIAIKKNKLENIIKVISPTINIIDYYNNADIVLLPSLHEGFPNVLLESWACKKPILISEEADTANIVVEGYGGWKFSAKSSENLAEKILHISSLSLNDLNNQGEIGYKIVKSKYSIKQVSEEYMSLYNAL